MTNIWTTHVFPGFSNGTVLAGVDGRSGVFGTGKTSAEAIGRLYLSHPELFPRDIKCLNYGQGEFKASFPASGLIPCAYGRTREEALGQLILDHGDNQTPKIAVRDEATKCQICARHCTSPEQAAHL